MRTTALTFVAPKAHTISRAFATQAIDLMGSASMRAWALEPHNFKLICQLGANLRKVKPKMTTMDFATQLTLLAMG